MVKEALFYARFMMKPERLRHTILVRDFSLMLAEIHNVDGKRVEIAAVFHDLFRDVPPQKLLEISKVWNLELDEVERKHPVLLHGKVASEFLRRRFGCEDEDILIAVAYHTSAHPNMGNVGKILVISDTVGFDRDFDGVDEIREVAKRNLDLAFREVVKSRIEYAVRTGRYVLLKSVETWNKLVEVIG